MPSSKAICLLARPATRPPSTSRSRGDSVASRPSISARSLCRLAAPACWRNAARTLCSKISSSKGFSRKSTAPNRMASTASGTSPWPVMTITGTSMPSSRTRRSRSIPLNPGIRTSVMMQVKPVSGSTSRNAAADAWLITSRSAVRNRKASESRSASSSSMTCTIAGSDDIAGFLLGQDRQREREYRAAAGIGPRHDRAAVRLDDGARDRQTDAHALSLGRDERLKQLRADLGRDSRPGIGNADFDHIFAHRQSGDDQFAPFDVFHRIDGVAHQIEQNLLDLHLVGEHEIAAVVEIEAHAHALVLGADQRQGAGLLDQLLDILHPALGLAAGHEVAQPANDLAGAQRLVAGLVHGITQRRGARVLAVFQKPPRALH